MSDHRTSTIDTPTVAGPLAAEVDTRRAADASDAEAIARQFSPPPAGFGGSIAVDVTGRCGTCLAPVEPGTGYCQQRCAALAEVLAVLGDVGTPIAATLPDVPTFAVDTTWRPLFAPGELDAALNLPVLDAPTVVLPTLPTLTAAAES